MIKNNRLFTTDSNNDLSFDDFIKKQQLRNKYRNPFKQKDIEGKTRHRKLKSALDQIKKRRQDKNPDKIRSFFENIHDDIGTPSPYEPPSN